MGAAPAWWSLIQAAKYLNVPPWDLAEQPVMWKRAALMAMEVEAAEQQRRSNKRQG